MFTPISSERPLVNVSSNTIREMLSLIRNSSTQRLRQPSFTHFEVLDNLKRKVWFLEQSHDETADQPPEGIKSFGDYFHRGVITPEDAILVTNAVYSWRMSILEHHGGWWVTIMEGSGCRGPSFQVSPELWGRMLSSLDDEVLRANATVSSVCRGIPHEATYRTFLEFIHEMHRSKDSAYSKQFDRPSLVTFSI